MSNTTRTVAAVLVSIALAGVSMSAKSAEPAAAGAKQAPQSEAVAGTRLAGIRAKYPHYAHSKTHDSNVIFDQSKLQRYDIWLEDASLASLDADPAAEKYVEGALLHDGKLIPAVGVRYKGKRGSFYGCLSGKNPFEPSGSKTCSKLSVKVKVDWNDPGDKFYGLKKLNFQSNNADRTMLHERLGYWLFNQFGVPASRSVHAKLYVNNHFVGVFTLTEEVDGAFEKRNFPDQRGSFYKEVWPLDGQGARIADAAIAEAAKSGKKPEAAKDFALFAADIERLGGKDSDEIMRKWFDIEATMRYVVVDRAILNDDGIFHWYCFDGKTCANQNFFWFQNSQTKQVRLIPWDLDMAFENLGEPKNPATPVGEWNKTQNDCAPFPSGSFGLIQRSAACDKLIRAITAYDKRYAELRAEFDKKHFNAATMGKLIDEWSAQIEPAVAEASAANSDQVTVETWRKAVAKLKADIAARPN